MRKKDIIKSFIGVGFLIILIIFSINSSSTKESSIIESQNPEQEKLTADNKKIAQKIEVVHFHATQQCISCITVGEYALKKIKERFPEEYANGTIVFKEINGELKENSDMVMRYKATGSSLFVNTIIDGKDNIEEDTTVWLKISNEQDFLNYFENKLNKLLGK